MSTHTLNVFDSGAQVATVEYESLDERFTLAYADEWRRTSLSYSISPHIPITGEPPASGTVRRFLENLLPEGRALVVSATYQVARNNVFGLIRELGQETSGALAFRVGQPAQIKETTRREIHKKELQRRIDERAEVPFSVWCWRGRKTA